MTSLAGGQVEEHVRGEETPVDARRYQTEVNYASPRAMPARHGTGSLGHRVNGSFGSSFTSGSPGHHFDPV